MIDTEIKEQLDRIEQYSLIAAKKCAQHQGSCNHTRHDGSRSKGKRQKAHTPLLQAKYQPTLLQEE